MGVSFSPSMLLICYFPTKKFSDIVNTSITENETLKKELTFTKSRLKESEHSLDRIKIALQESWDRAEREKFANEKKLNTELENQRITIETVKDNIVKQVHSRLKV